MVTTGWLTARHKDGRTGTFDWVALMFALGFVVYFGILGTGALLLLAAVGDVRMLARSGITGALRIGRHAWRMSFGLFIASGSFFLGQQQVFPARRRGSVMLIVLGVFPLGLFVFWECGCGLARGSERR